MKRQSKLTRLQSALNVMTLRAERAEKSSDSWQRAFNKEALSHADTKDRCKTLQGLLIDAGWTQELLARELGMAVHYPPMQTAL